MEAFSDTEIGEAKLLSMLSGRPAKICGDVFAWNGHLIDRATAIVALLKINNQVPVSDGVKLRLKENYERKFASYKLSEDFADINDDKPITAARIWFNIVCHTIKSASKDKAELKAEEVKSILIELHRN